MNNQELVITESNAPGFAEMVCMKDGAKLLCIEKTGTGMENSEVVPFK